MIDSRKIAVLGGGSGGHCMAADLTLKGYDVVLCEAPEFKESFTTALERQAIDLIDASGKQQTVKIAKVTIDFAETMKDASFVMIAAPAEGAVKLFEYIIPYLKDGHTILKWAGNFSALQFAEILREKGIKKDITLAEGHTLPWGCRLIAPTIVEIMVWVVELKVCALPAKNTDKVINDIGKMYPVVAGENVLASTFNNLNPIVHPVGTIMNAGWVDTKGKDFYFYRDGTTLSIARGIKAVFKEVSDVAKAIGISMIEYPEEDFWKKSTIMSTYSRAVFDKEGATARISGPSSLTSRYITEDLPYGLVPIVHLAHKFDVATPVIDSVIRLASVVNETDYMKEGLSLEELGLATLSKNEIMKLLQEG